MGCPAFHSYVNSLSSTHKNKSTNRRSSMPVSKTFASVTVSSGQIPRGFVGIFDFGFGGFLRQPRTVNSGMGHTNHGRRAPRAQGSGSLQVLGADCLPGSAERFSFGPAPL